MTIGGGGAAPGVSVTCLGCKQSKQKAAFSTTQWKKRPGSRCVACLGGGGCGGGMGRGGGGGGGASPAGGSSTSANGGGGGGGGGGGKKPRNNPNSKAPSLQLTNQLNQKPSPLSLDPRPQKAIPGFEELGLTCCADWPRTKRGTPPNAQSAVFNPLLACVLGPFDGYCTAEQLAFAGDWWALALPAWPRWVASLRASGAGGRRDALLQRAKGHPNPLVPRAKGRGSVPHFNGRCGVPRHSPLPPLPLPLPPPPR
jgi:hypothetical protein